MVGRGVNSICFFKKHLLLIICVPFLVGKTYLAWRFSTSSSLQLPSSQASGVYTMPCITLCSGPSNWMVTFQPPAPPEDENQSCAVDHQLLGPSGISPGLELGNREPEAWIYSMLAPGSWPRSRFSPSCLLLALKTMSAPSL